MNHRFPRTARVRARAEFDAVFKQAKRVAAPTLALHWLVEGCEPRLGLAVSRKVSPHAVVRNRIKRTLRDQFRRMRGDLPAGDYVLVARPGAAASPLLSLRAEFVALLARAGALPPSPASGTMPAASPPTHSAPAASGR